MINVPESLKRSGEDVFVTICVGSTICKPSFSSVDKSWMGAHPCILAEVMDEFSLLGHLLFGKHEQIYIKQFNYSRRSLVYRFSAWLIGYISILPHHASWRDREVFRI